MKTAAIKIKNIETEPEIPVYPARQKMLDLFMDNFEYFLPFNTEGLLDYNPVNEDSYKIYQISDNCGDVYNVLIDFDLFQNQYCLRIMPNSSKLVKSIIPNHNTVIFAKTDADLVKVFYTIVHKVLDHKRDSDFTKIITACKDHNISIKTKENEMTISSKKLCKNIEVKITYQKYLSETSNYLVTLNDKSYVYNHTNQIIKLLSKILSI